MDRTGFRSQSAGVRGQEVHEGLSFNRAIALRMRGNLGKGFAVPDLNKDEQKQVIKQALREFLDEKYAEFGKWSAGAFIGLALAALVYLILWANGWRK